MKLKWDELKEQKAKSRQVNKIMEDNFMQAFGISEDQMEKASSMLGISESTEHLGNLSVWLVRDDENKEVSKDTVEKEVFVINTGKTKGTTFKLKQRTLHFHLFLILVHRWVASSMILCWSWIFYTKPRSAVHA